MQASNDLSRGHRKRTCTCTQNISARAFSSCLRTREEARHRSDIEHNHFIHLSIPASISICTDWGRLQVKYSEIRRRLMWRHSRRWADVRGLESSWRESLDWLQGLRTKLCLAGAATRSLYGQTKALGESLKAGATTLGHRQCVWLEWEALPKCACAEHYHHDLILCRSEVTLEKWKLWHCFSGIFGSAHAATQWLIFAVPSYSYLQYLSILYTVFQVGQAICSRPFDSHA